MYTLRSTGRLEFSRLAKLQHRFGISVVERSVASVRQGTSKGVSHGMIVKGATRPHDGEPGCRQGFFAVDCFHLRAETPGRSH